MELSEAKYLAINLMAKHGLTKKGWSFEFNTRKRSLGMCSFGVKKISLSSIFTTQLPQSEVQDTILHEIAHALVGSKHGHDNTWKRKAIEIGCNGQRCANLTEIELNIQAKYIAQCKHCGKKYYAHRKRKRKSSCRCSGLRVFQESHLLDFVQQY